MKKLLLIMLIFGCHEEAEQVTCRNNDIATQIREIAYLSAVGNCWKTGASLAYNEEDKEKRLEHLYYIRDCYVKEYERILESQWETQK